MSNTEAGCPKCGAPKTDKTLQTGLCEYCGAILEEKKAACESVLTVYGYTEWLAIRPPVVIYKDGIEIGKVDYQSTTKIQIEKDCMLNFSFRLGLIPVKTSYYAHAGKNQSIQISYNRFLGTIKVKEIQ